MSVRQHPPRPETTGAARSVGLRLLVFLLSLLAVWGTLQFLVWPHVQPLYAAAVAGVADTALGFVELGQRVTHLEASGSIINVFTQLSEDESPLLRWDADVMHFYVVLYTSLFLVFPSLGIRKRLALLGSALAGLFLFHVTAILIKVEYLYAVEMEEISARHYSSGEIAVYSWLHDTFIFFAVQLVPAAALAVLVVLYGGFGRGALGALRKARPGRVAAARNRARRSGWKRFLPPAAAGLLAPAVMIFLLGLKVPARQAEVNSRLGYRWLQVPDSARAARQFESALEKVPDLVEARMGLGLVRMLDRDYSSAAGVFGEVLELDPGNTQALLQQGRAFISMKDFLGAVEPLERFVRAQPDDEEGGYLLALALKRVDRRADAETVLLRVLESHPDSVRVLMDLAASLFVTGRSCEAGPYLDRLTQLPLDEAQAALVVETQAEIRQTCTGG